jgi:hypothetical protein
MNQNKIKQVVRRIVMKYLQITIYPKISEVQSIDGYLSRLEAISLFSVAHKLPRNSNIVEIGSWKGKSTYCLSKGLRQGTVYAIDPFNAEGDPDSEASYEKNQGIIPLLDQFQNNMKRLDVFDKIVTLQGYSSDFIGKIPDISLLFIDGDHSINACKFDYENFSPNIICGGYLLFHDYRPLDKNLGPTWLIENVIVPSNKFTHIRTFDSLWVGQKK